MFIPYLNLQGVRITGQNLPIVGKIYRNIKIPETFTIASSRRADENGSFLDPVTRHIR
jgi:hypothetical protein